MWRKEGKHGTYYLGAGEDLRPGSPSDSKTSRQSPFENFSARGNEKRFARTGIAPAHT